MKTIYHGTTTPNIAILEPRKRFTPGGANIADMIKPRIYASYVPAFAVAHGFPWSSADGIDIEISEGKVTLVLPKNKSGILDQKVCLYELPDTTFVHTDEEETGLTYHTEVNTVPLSVKCFASISEAMEVNGGRIRLF